MNHSMLQPSYLSIERIIIDELSVHPNCKLIDIYKLLFQAFYGPSHAITDLISISLGINTEYTNMTVPYKPVIQDIGMGIGYCRISLSAFDKLPPSSLLRNCELLANLMQQSCIAEPVAGSMSSLWQHYKKTILDFFPASNEEWNAITTLAENNIIPSHSDDFKQTYDPHYRIIANDLAKTFLNPITKSI